MNPEIAKLIGRLRNEAASQEFELTNCEDLLREAADTFQAVFDPENQPSQYGTVLRPTENQIGAIVEEAVKNANHGNDVDDFERYAEYERHAARYAIEALINRAL